LIHGDDAAKSILQKSLKQLFPEIMTVIP
jgi:3'-phosphoadenosine 5'-phosphosulfate (PAPS) 3'-phosphatase